MPKKKSNSPPTLVSTTVDNWHNLAIYEGSGKENSTRYTFVNCRQPKNTSVLEKRARRLQDTPLAKRLPEANKKPTVELETSPSENRYNLFNSYDTKEPQAEQHDSRMNILYILNPKR